MLMYVIAETEFGPCKIGYSDRLAHRLSCLQSGNPRKLTLAFSIECPPNYRKAEKLAHNLARYGRRKEMLHGEWFNITVSDAIMIVREACERADRGYFLRGGNAPSGRP